MDAFTAVESAADAAVEMEVLEPFRRKDAGSRVGRGALGEALVGLLLFMRAASCVNDGKRLLVEDLGASAGGGAEDIVAERQTQRLIMVSLSSVVSNIFLHQNLIQVDFSSFGQSGPQKQV